MQTFKNKMIKKSVEIIKEKKHIEQKRKVENCLNFFMHKEVQNEAA